MELKFRIIFYNRREVRTYVSIGRIKAPGSPYIFNCRVFRGRCSNWASQYNVLCTLYRHEYKGK